MVVPSPLSLRRGGGGSSNNSSNVLRFPVFLFMIAVPIVLFAVYNTVTSDNNSNNNQRLRLDLSEQHYDELFAQEHEANKNKLLMLPPLPAELAVFREPLQITKETGKWHDPAQRDSGACASSIPSWIMDMQPAIEYKVFSQYGEDGVMAFILDRLPAPAVPRTFVEFGVETGVECNTRYLREMQNWTGLMLDGGTDNAAIGLHQEMIHPDNIVSLFEKYNVQKDFGYFSEDTDYADHYIWRNILDAGYRPRVLISETNSNLFPDESVTVHDPGRKVRMWSGYTDYFGVSPLALKRLWNKHGYLMIYCTKEQVNCFGLHQDDVLPLAQRNPAGLKAAQECLWNKPLTWPVKLHSCDPNHEKWLHVDEDGRVTDKEVTPRVVEYCKIVLPQIQAEEEAARRKNGN